MKPYNKEESKRIQIRRMFNNIAPYYDRICHILSFNIDRLWRKRLVELVAERKPTNIVDIATGTGDVAISMAKKIPTSQIVGIDLSEEMLKVAQQKIEHFSIKPNIRLLCEDAENLSLSSNTFDVVTISFGIRNFENIVKGLSECYRILKEGGSLFIMEFSTPKRMNSYLKEIADVCGIHKNLSTHTARHSYATSICLANGVSMENVAKMLGHADTSVTKHYARVLDQNIFKDMQKVNSCLSELTI